ncbi:alpha/beta hydrolase, partial [Teichococcus cervicalis]
MTPPVTLPRSGWWDMEAGAARRHRVFLAWPEAPPPPGGYPVLLLLDANAGFGTAVDAYRAMTWRDTPGRPAPALIVGLGHPGDAAYAPEARRHDYTPPLPGAAQEEEAGADALLRFIEAALLPALARRHPVDAHQLALFGHSLGGLFALHALFARPGLFRAIVAASPSLWWGEGAMLA